MASSPARRRRGAGFGTFYIGLSIIGAATVLNVAYDRLSWVGVEVMPQFLTHMYESSGKTTVTVAFVAFGLSIILLGFALRRGDDEEPADESRPEGISATLYSAADSPSANAPKTTPSGQVILRTQQYLRRKEGPAA